MPKKARDEEYQPSNSMENEDDSDNDFKPKKPLRSNQGRRASSKGKPTNVQEKDSARSSSLKGHQPDNYSASQIKTQIVKEGNSREVGSTDEDETEDKIANVPRNFEYCPICQIPLNLLKISPAMHTASCNISEDLKACPDGLSCLNSNLFHYRDFSHHELAAFRDSEDFVEPDIIFSPQKAKVKRTPLKSTGSKKRPSKSPVVPDSKVPKMDEPGCSKVLPPTPTSPDLFNAGSERRKKLSFEDSEENDGEASPPEVPTNSTGSHFLSQTDGEEHCELPETFSQASLWCSDLRLSGDTPCASDIAEPDACEHFPCIIKQEPESQDNEDTHFGDHFVSNAQIEVQYSDKVDEHNVTGSNVQCSEKCQAHMCSDSQDTVQANCSVVFKATGINRAEAMARSPMSITFMVNKAGWQAVEIKGTKSSTAQKVDVSLCECGHSVDLKCCLHDRDFSSDEKFDLDQHEIFFATMADMGLRNEPSSCDFVNRKKNVTSSCNQITLSSVADNPNIHSHVPESELKANKTSAACSVEMNAEKVVDAFALLRKNSKSGKVGSSSSSSGHQSKSSKPNVAPLVVSHTTGSSWTLVPALGKQDPTYGRPKTAIKKVPAYKRIPDTPFVVDVFNHGIIPGVKAYFLSHFHSDHYMGLGKNFNGPIYCSQVTANLVHLKLRVAKEHLHVLKIGEPRVVSSVEVEIFDAFHCPGAVMFLFRLLDGKVFLHVGDFRAQPSMEEYPQLRLVDKLFLDTTYCDPAYDFPSQDEVVLKVIGTVREHLARNKSTLIVSGTYTIGKEKVFMGIAEEFDFKIWTTADKRKIYNCLEDKKLLNRLTTDPFDAQIHVLSMKDIALEELLKHLSKHNRFSHIVGIKPTGWQTSTTLRGKPSDFQRSIRGKATIYGVPYSEHSSYSELRRFVRYIKPKDIQVTVNVGRAAQYRKIFQKWLSNAGESQPKVLQYFLKDSVK